MRDGVVLRPRLAADLGGRLAVAISCVVGAAAAIGSLVLVR